MEHHRLLYSICRPTLQRQSLASYSFATFSRPIDFLFAKQQFKMGGGPKVPYPKHVWSPAGGWYAQPSNWKVNTAVFGAAVLGLTALTWNMSANREFRHKMPRPDRFYPSRNWTKQIKEHEKAAATAASAGETSS